jgi:predicted dehydrogenase
MTEKVRMGILGAADIAVVKVVPAMQQAANCEVVALASRDAARARDAADRLGIATAHGSYTDLLEDEEVDAVYIPLPNHLHAEWTMQAAAHGKHVLCEKPLALSAAEARVMAEACEAAGVVLMEAFMYRLHPTWRKVRELVAAGTIGDLRAVQVWFSYFNDDPHNIRNVRDYGGGALMDIGCYPVNAARMLFGAEPDTVAARIVRDPSSGVDTTTAAVLGFGDAVATFTVSIRSEPDQRVDVYGTTGRISVEIPFNIPPDRETRVFLTAGGNPPVASDTTALTFPAVDQYTLETEEFCRAVLEGTPVPTTPADGVANMVVLERIVAAAWE